MTSQGSKTLVLHGDATVIPHLEDAFLYPSEIFAGRSVRCLRADVRHSVEVGIKGGQATHHERVAVTCLTFPETHHHVAAAWIGERGCFDQESLICGQIG